MSTGWTKDLFITDNVFPVILIYFELKEASVIRALLVEIAFSIALNRHRN